LLAALRCSFFGIHKPEIKLSANFISNGCQELPVTVLIHKKYRANAAEVFLIELPIEGLRPGRYSLCLFANEVKTESESRLNIPFYVK